MFAGPGLGNVHLEWISPAEPGDAVQSHPIESNRLCTFYWPKFSGLDGEARLPVELCPCAELEHWSPGLPEEPKRRALTQGQCWYVRGCSLSLQRAHVEAALTNEYCFPGNSLAYSCLGLEPGALLAPSSNRSIVTVYGMIQITHMPVICYNMPIIWVRIYFSCSLHFK